VPHVSAASPAQPMHRRACILSPTASRALARSFNFDSRKGPVNVQWFTGAETNMAYNCVDRHVEAGHGDRVAFYWEGNDLGEDSVTTYSQLLAQASLAQHSERQTSVRSAWWAAQPLGPPWLGSRRAGRGTGVGRVCVCSRRLGQALSQAELHVVECTHGTLCTRLPATFGTPARRAPSCVTACHAQECAHAVRRQVRSARVETAWRVVCA